MLLPYNSLQQALRKLGCGIQGQNFVCLVRVEQLYRGKLYTFERFAHSGIARWMSHFASAKSVTFLLFLKQQMIFSSKD